MQRLIRFLQFLRLADENGQLSLTTIGFAIGCIAILACKPVSLPELSVFAIGLGGYHAKKFQSHSRAKQAMASAHEAGLARLAADKDVALAQRADHVEETQSKVAQLEAKVKELATPERMEALKAIVRR